MTRYEGRTFDEARAEIAGRHVTAEPDPPERYHLYRLCECTTCGGTGKDPDWTKDDRVSARCQDCRGEGRTRDLVATAGSPEAVGVAIVTLAREGEFTECPFGLLDSMGETGQKWLILPYGPSARNISDAGRTLAKARKTT